MRRLTGGAKTRIVVLRMFDVVCSLAGLILLAPVFAWIALEILWDDGSPVLFHQTRVGRNGRLFSIWKFRTMRTGIEGRAITVAGDDRVTKMGGWLRKFKLDELPQLVNVLRGDMSLIGPRPEVPEYVQLDSPLWRDVLRVRPGITDAATLLHRNEEEMLRASSDPNAYYRSSLLPAKLNLNLAYLRSRSFSLDLRLIFLTLLYSVYPKSFDRDRVRRVLGIGVEI